MAFLKGLTRCDAIDVAARKLQYSDPNQARSTHHPTIDVDCNNIINIVGRNVNEPLKATAQFLVEWAQSRAIMTPICDGDHRPNAKQASNKNNASRIRSRNKAIIARRELNSLRDRLKFEKMDENQERELLLKEQRASSL